MKISVEESIAVVSLHPLVKAASLSVRPNGLDGWLALQLPEGGTWISLSLVLEGLESGNLMMVIPSEFPASLPFFFFTDQDKLPRIPHLMPNGWVCYYRQEALIIDLDRPLDVLWWSIEKVLAILVQGMKGENLEEHLTEYAAYWRLIAGQALMLWTGAAGKQPKEIKRYISREGHQLGLDKAATVLGASRTNPMLSGSIEQKGIYVPLLKVDKLPLPPLTGFWNPKALLGILERQMTNKERKRLHRLINNGRHHFVIVALFSPGNDLPILVGIDAKFAHTNQNHGPLTNPIQLTPFNVVRMDRDYLLTRGGGFAELSEKKVLLIGAGSVGGYVAHALAKSGVGAIEILDKDILLPENAYRHVMGFSPFPIPKATGLAAVLKQQHPEMRTAGGVSDARNTQQFDPIASNNFHLIIVATGDPTTDLLLNAYFHQQSSAPVIYAWNEAHGLGGHALLACQGDRKGCLRCLYESLPAGPHNRASFAEAGQHFERTMDGCGTAFTPFSGIDSMQTAILATRLAVQTLLGQANENQLWSWKGDDTDFVAHGHKTSARFNFAASKPKVPATEYAQAACPICGIEAA